MNQGKSLRSLRPKLLGSFVILGALSSFSGIALAAAPEAPSAPPAATPSAAESNKEEISNGSVIQLGEGVSIAPISGWKIERKSMGMGLVMKEVLPPVQGPVDYSKPIFARNITLTTLPVARPIDELAVDEVKAEISKMIARDPSLKDFQFTDSKFFDYRGKSDGLILFSQLTVNGFSMMQMQVIVSGATKSYLMTYSDLASNFSTPASYDAAWKSMTSLVVQGVAPVRFEKEILLGGSVVLVLFALITPFLVLRWRSSRKIRLMADELQHDWDHGTVKTDADYDLSSISGIMQTKLNKKKSSKKFMSSDDFDSSAVSGI